MQAFQPQSVSVAEAPLYLIEFSIDSTYSWICTSIIIPDGTNQVFFVRNTNSYWGRAVTIQSGIATFGNGCYNEGSYTNPSAALPMKIYGIY